MTRELLDKGEKYYIEFKEGSYNTSQYVIIN